MLTLLLIGLVGALAIVYGLSGGNPSSLVPFHHHTTTTQKPKPKPLGPLEVSPMRQVSFTETCSTCTTENFLTGATTAGRTIKTDLWYPTRDGSTPAATNARTPLILLAVGFDLDPTDYQVLVDEWVRAGFVVAAPVFPDTDAAAVAPVLKQYPDPSRDDPHGSPETDVAHQPRDVAFVLGQLVNADRAPANPATPFLHGLFDPSAIGVAGQSDGGDTVAALFYSGCCRGVFSVPVKAVAVLSGAEETGWFGSTWFAAPGPPLLVVQGTADACNSPALSTQLYAAAPAAAGKYFVTLLGADHLAAYTQSGNFSAAAGAATSAFFTLYLRPGSLTPASVVAAGTTSVSTATDAATPPALKAVTPTWSYNPGTPQDPCSLSFTGPPPSTAPSST